MRRNFTEKTHAPDGSKTISQLNREDDEWRAKQPMVVRCALCPWTFEGATSDATEAATEHRREQHPELLVGGRKNGKADLEREAEWRRGRAALDAMDDGEPQPAAEETGHAEAPDDMGIASGTDGGAEPATAAADESQCSEVGETSKKTRGVKWTREKVLDLVRSLSSDGVAPSSTAAMKEGLYWETIKRLFGTYSALVEAAGLQPARTRRRVREGSERTALRGPSGSPPSAAATPEPTGNGGSTVRSENTDPGGGFTRDHPRGDRGCPHLRRHARATAGDR